jgi:hypothetical protein
MFLGAPVAVRHEDVRGEYPRRAGRAGISASRLVPVAQQVVAAARTDFDESIRVKPECRFQTLKHVVWALPERHPRRKLRLPRVEHFRRTGLRHAREAERKT